MLVTAYLACQASGRQLRPPAGNSAHQPAAPAGRPPFPSVIAAQTVLRLLPRAPPPTITGNGGLDVKEYNLPANMYSDG